jgi:hypothetical protein
MVALGIEPDALNRLLRVRRPQLPDWLQRVEVEQLPLGDATVSLHFERCDGTTRVSVAGTRGDVSVEQDE